MREQLGVVEGGKFRMVRCFRYAPVSLPSYLRAHQADDIYRTGQSPARQNRSFSYIQM